MSISQIKRQAKASLKGYWGTAILLSFLVFLISVFVPIIIESILIGGFSNFSNQDNAQGSSSLLEFLFSLVLMPLTVSVAWFYLALIRNDRQSISSVFGIYKDGKRSLKLVGASLLQRIYILLWALLFIIPGIIKALAYSQTFLLLKDHPEYTVIEAITESKNRMKGYKGKFFLLQLSFIGWGILCLLTLGIGFLWLVPYMGASYAAFYNELIYPQGSGDLLEKEILE